MSKITKKYWKWDVNIPVSGIHFGQSVAELLDKGIIEKDPDDPSEYQGLNQIPWRIKAVDGKVTSIGFRQAFFDFINPDLWRKNSRSLFYL